MNNNLPETVTGIVNYCRANDAEQSYGYVAGVLHENYAKRIQLLEEALRGIAVAHYASFDDEYCWCRKGPHVTRPNGRTHENYCQVARAALKH